MFICNFISHYLYMYHNTVKKKRVKKLFRNKIIDQQYGKVSAGRVAASSSYNFFQLPQHLQQFYIFHKSNSNTNPPTSCSYKQIHHTGNSDLKVLI